MLLLLFLVLNLHLAVFSFHAARFLHLQFFIPLEFFKSDALHLQKHDKHLSVFCAEIYWLNLELFQWSKLYLSFSFCSFIYFFFRFVWDSSWYWIHFNHLLYIQSVIAEISSWQETSTLLEYVSQSFLLFLFSLQALVQNL